MTTDPKNPSSEQNIIQVTIHCNAWMIMHPFSGDGRIYTEKLIYKGDGLIPYGKIELTNNQIDGACLTLTQTTSENDVEGI